MSESSLGFYDEEPELWHRKPHSRADTIIYLIDKALAEYEIVPVVKSAELVVFPEH